MRLRLSWAVPFEENQPQKLLIYRDYGRTASDSCLPCKCWCRAVSRAAACGWTNALHVISYVNVAINCSTPMMHSLNSIIAMATDGLEANRLQTISSHYADLTLCDLTHLLLDKMADISQRIVSDTFSWMKSCIFQLKFHWNLFLRVQLTITQHWFR